MKYYIDAKPSQCRGYNLTGMHITPEFYNTTYLYKPAKLYTQTYSSIDNYTKLYNMEIPLKVYQYSINLDDDGEYTVGETILLYKNLNALETFTCYIKDNEIVARSNEYNEMAMRYKSAIAGIISASIFAVGIIIIVICVIYEEYIKPTLIESSRKHATLENVELNMV
jgi:hypothetical protein